MDIQNNLPKNINKVVPTPNSDAKNIVGLVKEDDEVVGYKLSDNSTVSREEGVRLAKNGGIYGVAVATNQGNEYLRTLPDQTIENNLGNLPVEEAE